MIPQITRIKICGIRVISIIRVSIFAEYTQKNSILGIKEYSYQEEKEIDVGGA